MARSLGIRSATVTVAVLLAMVVATPVAAAANAIQNGDFTASAAGQPVADWSQTDVTVNPDGCDPGPDGSPGGGGCNGPFVSVSTNMQCDPLPVGTPFLALDVPDGTDAYVTQQVTVPANGVLSFKAWDNLDPATALVSASNGATTVEQEFTPPSLESGTGSTCTGNSVYNGSMDLSQYSGQSVTLKLEATGAGAIGTYVNFDDLVLAGAAPTLRTSATNASCSLVGTGAPGSYFDCTATVADASGKQPADTPTGIVKFSVNSGGGGGFQGSSSCALKPSQSGPTAFCDVIYNPPAAGIAIGSQPPLTAAYQGNTQLATSSFNLATSPPPYGANQTSTSVICNLDTTTNVDTCGATVGSVSGSSTPTGNVTFSIPAGSGTLLGSICQLSPTPLSPGVASCTVQYRPADPTTFPNVTANYPGDRTFAPSSGTTGFLNTGNVSGLENDNGPTTNCGCCPAANQAGTANRPPLSGPPGSPSEPGGSKGANKLCYLLATYPEYRGTIFICGLALAGTEETVVVPLACAAALALDGLTVKWLFDPPDRNYLALALEHAAPVTLGQVRIRCGRLSRRACTSLSRAYAAYVSALRAVGSATAGLATTGDRLASARKAHDAAAILFQIAARKVYAGEAATAYATLDRAAFAFARLLLRDHLNGPLASLSVPTFIARLRHKDPAGLRAAVADSGHSLAAFEAMLERALKADRSLRTPTLASVLEHRIAYGGLLLDYRSIRLVHIRAIVVGLGRDRVLSVETAGALLRDLTCTSTSKTLSLAPVRMALKQVTPGAIRSLLQFAIAPLGARAGCA